MFLPALATHHFENKQVRTVAGADGETWFVAADVCRVLEIDNVTNAIRILDEDEKGLHTIKTPGGDQALNIISEPGLYKLMGRSRKPEAKRFDRWVRHEVLPSIRKTGSYNATVPQIDVRNPSQLAQIAIQLIEVNQELQAVNAALAPKADFYDRFANADGLYGLQNAGRLLGLGPNKFVGSLKRDYLFYQGGALVPYRQYVQQGLFEVKTEIVNDKSRPQTFITPKGVQYLAKKMGISLSGGEMH